MLERDFQKNLKKEIKKMFPNCIIFKTDANQIQGFPDLLILNGNKWAALENKRSADASKRPNQEYWVERLNKMSFARFIYPGNKEEVLNALYESLKP